MRRREFLRWFRSAPLAAPFVVAGVARAGEDQDKVLRLGGKKVMEVLDNGDIALGEKGNIRITEQR